MLRKYALQASHLPLFPRIPPLSSDRASIPAPVTSKAQEKFPRIRIWVIKYSLTFFSFVLGLVSFAHRGASAEASHWPFRPAPSAKWPCPHLSSGRAQERCEGPAIQDGGGTPRAPSRLWRCDPQPPATGLRQTRESSAPFPP